jgi:hypothetical protein
MEAAIVIVVLIVIAGVAIGLLDLAGQAEKQRTIMAAKRAYGESLELLKTSPANPGIRQQTLQIGRGYSNLSRDSKGVAIFDEVALLNDINAVCAATAVAIGTTPQRTTSDKLAELKELLTKGLISQSEHSELRSQLLGEFAATDVR